MPRGGHEEEESCQPLLSGQLKMSAVARPFSYPTSTHTFLSGHILYILSKVQSQLLHPSRSPGIQVIMCLPLIWSSCERRLPIISVTSEAGIEVGVFSGGFTALVAYFFLCEFDFQRLFLEFNSSRLS